MKLSLLATAAFAVAASAVNLPKPLRFGRRDVNSTLPAANTTVLSLDNVTAIYGGDQVLYPTLLPNNNGIAWVPAGAAPQLGGEQQTHKTPTNNFDEPLDTFSLRVMMGKKKMNVGNLVDDELRKEIAKGLDKLCPEGRGECFTQDELDHIIKIRYINNGRNLEGKARLWIKTSGYDGPGSKEIVNTRRKLMIDSIAMAFQSMSTDKKNCYEAESKGKHWGEFCNVGEWAEANVSDQDWIEAHYEATGDMTDRNRFGKFDCVAVINSVRRGVEPQLVEYSRAYHGAYRGTLVIGCPEPDPK